MNPANEPTATNSVSMTQETRGRRRGAAGAAAAEEHDTKPNDGTTTGEFTPAVAQPIIAAWVTTDCKQQPNAIEDEERGGEGEELRKLQPGADPLDERRREAVLAAGHGEILQRTLETSDRKEGQALIRKGGQAPIRRRRFRLFEIPASNWCLSPFSN